jgi:hypothetical protein
MALFAIGWCIPLPYAGYAAEPFALALMPVAAYGLPLWRVPNVRLLVMAYSLLLIGLVVSDVANGTGMEIAVRSWLNPIFAAIETIFVVSCVLKKPSSIVTFLIFTGIFKGLFGEPAYGMDDKLDVLLAEQGPLSGVYVKVRIVPFVAPLIILSGYLVYRVSRLAAACVYFSAGAAFIYLDARSVGLNFILSSIIVGVTFFRPRIAFREVALVGALTAPALLMAYQSYAFYTLHFNLSSQSGAQLRRAVNPYNPLEIFLQGRSEWTVASMAISDKPILGHGSLALDVENKYSYYRAIFTNDFAGLHVLGALERVRSIPAHSVLVAGWIWGGLLGFFGAALLGLIALKAGGATLAIRNPFIPVSAAFFFTILWELLFSPLIAIRISFPVTFGFLIAMSLLLRRSHK